MHAITKRVIGDFNTFTEQAFFNKYSCKKARIEKGYQVWRPIYECAVSKNQKVSCKVLF